MLPVVVAVLVLVAAQDPATIVYMSAPDEPAPGQAPPLRTIARALAIPAGILGGLGLAMNVARIALVSRPCTPESDCLEYRVYIGLSPAAGVSNIAATALAGAAGNDAGRHEAWKTAHGGGPERKAKAYVGGGAALLGLGIGAYLTGRLLLARDGVSLFSCIAEGANECVDRPFAGRLAVITLGQAAIVAGAGVLAFGISYSSARGRLAGTVARLRLAPSFAPSWAGLSLWGSF